MCPFHNNYISDGRYDDDVNKLGYLSKCICKRAVTQIDGNDFPESDARLWKCQPLLVLHFHVLALPLIRPLKKEIQHRSVFWKVRKGVTLIGGKPPLSHYNSIIYVVLNLTVSIAVVAGKVLNTDLRHYLSLQFQKGSLDHKLQQIIRDNLYLRTIPCKYLTPDCTFNTLTSNCEKKMRHALTRFQTT